MQKSSGMKRDRSIDHESVEVPAPLLHETIDKLRNLIRCRIEREMPRVEDVDFGVRNVATIGLRFRKVERRIVFSPDDEKPGLVLAHPRLPFRVVVHVGSIVVEQVSLNVRLPRLTQER